MQRQEAAAGSTLCTVFRLLLGQFLWSSCYHLIFSIVCTPMLLIGMGLQVDRGFVAQVADVIGGREAPLNAEQRTEGEKTVPGEFSKVKHVRGILSMGR